MYVRILSAFLVMLVLVCFLLLPSAAYAMESGLTLGWDGQDNVGARTTRPASASTLINLNDDNPRMNVAADARRASDAERTAPAVAPAVLAPHAQKEIGKALEALRANKLHEARSHLDAAYRLAPTSADVNFIFGVYSSQANNFDRAKSYWKRTLELNPKHLSALLSLGDLLLREKNPDEALPLLKRAAEVEPSSWRSHALLCHGLLLQGSLDEAIEQAERALELGHGPATVIEPLLATALAGRGDVTGAISVLQAFLKEHPTDATAKQQLRSLQTSQVAVVKNDDTVHANQIGSQDISNVVPDLQLERLQTSRLPVDNGPASIGENQIVVPDLTAAITSLPLPSNWLPPGVDERVPPVEADAACALDDVLQKAGKRIQEFVSNVDRFTATESLKHESINKWGLPSTLETRKFDYVVGVQEIRPGHLSVEEYRSSHGSAGDFPDGVATIGLPALVLIFHPYNVEAFEMTCEGLARWNGALGWQVHFRQRSDKPNTIRSYRTGNGASYRVALKGRAWIAADSYQILRLETDLIAPVPEIRLATDRAIIEYGPVHFREGKVDMWLPQSAELYYDWKGRRSHRRHGFSNYLLFSVEDKQRIYAPKIEDESATNQTQK
jgi:tetratricopeptide (TPR) repeat protein